MYALIAPCNNWTHVGNVCVRYFPIDCQHSQLYCSSIMWYIYIFIILVSFQFHFSFISIMILLTINKWLYRKVKSDYSCLPKTLVTVQSLSQRTSQRTSSPHYISNQIRKEKKKIIPNLLYHLRTFERVRVEKMSRCDVFCIMVDVY